MDAIDRPPVEVQCRDIAYWGRIALPPGERQAVLDILLREMECEPSDPATMPVDASGCAVFSESRGKNGMVTTEVDLTALAQINPELLFRLYAQMRARVDALDRPAAPQ